MIHVKPAPYRTVVFASTVNDCPSFAIHVQSPVGGVTVVLNVAVIVLFASIVTVHVLVVEVHPVQLENWYPDAGVAVNVTAVPDVYDV